MERAMVFLFDEYTPNFNASNAYSVVPSPHLADPCNTPGITANLVSFSYLYMKTLLIIDDILIFVP